MADRSAHRFKDRAAGKRKFLFRRIKDLDEHALHAPVSTARQTRLHPGQTAGGKASLLVTMGQNNGGLFVLDVDLESGRCRQYPVANGVDSTFPTAAVRSLRTIGETVSPGTRRFLTEAWQAPLG